MNENGTKQKESVQPSSSTCGPVYDGPPLLSSPLSGVPLLVLKVQPSRVDLLSRSACNVPIVALSSQVSDY